MILAIKLSSKCIINIYKFLSKFEARVVHKHKYIIYEYATLIQSDNCHVFMIHEVRSTYGHAGTWYPKGMFSLCSSSICMNGKCNSQLNRFSASDEIELKYDTLSQTALYCAMCLQIFMPSNTR